MMFIFVLCGALVFADQADEYQVKAAFLCKFASFAEWSSRPLPERNAPFHIGILGEDPFGDILDQFAGEHTIHGREVGIQRSQRAAELVSCHVVYISKSLEKTLERLLPELTRAGVLTVGDTPGYAKRGCVINLVTIEGRIRFEVNSKAAEAARIKISSELLKLAILVEPEDSAGEGEGE